MNEDVQTVAFNLADVGPDEQTALQSVLQDGQLCGGGACSARAEAQLQQRLDSSSRIMLTTSCTAALEMSAILLRLQPGDEVIVPSFTFVSTALAFHMHGAKIVFADIRSDTLNIDETTLEALVTDKTRAIVPVHYAGVACEMDEIMSIAEKYDLVVIEDNAHGLFGQYKGKKLGTIGHMATLSFHETKNITCGEGGALILNQADLVPRAEMIIEKGTDRQKFFRGEVDKYGWVDKGSSYILSDILAAMLTAQINRSPELQKRRETLWHHYFEALSQWAANNQVQLPANPKHCESAFHLFYLLLPEHKVSAFMAHMAARGIKVAFHYTPLHNSTMAKTEQYLAHCPITETVAKRLIRLPLYSRLQDKEQAHVINAVTAFK